MSSGWTRTRASGRTTISTSATRPRLEEFAPDHAGEFDVALAVFVLEHVADPQAFTAACARTLRPGGLFFALTVHKYQYFGLTTWATTRLHVNDWLLLHLKPEDVVAGYHFPTEYRMNSPPSAAGTSARTGSVPPSTGCTTSRTSTRGTCRTRSSRSRRRGRRLAYRMNSPWLMGTLSFRAIR